MINAFARYMRLYYLRLLSHPRNTHGIIFIDETSISEPFVPLLARPNIDSDLSGL
jgi:hypothetical protein